MLARAKRLRKDRDIQRVFRLGRPGGNDLIGLKTLPNKLGVSRAALVVSGKISKKAVVRNRIRRRLSGQLEELWQTIPPGYDIVISARADLSVTPVVELKRSIVVGLARTGISLKE